MYLFTSESVFAGYPDYPCEQTGELAWFKSIGR